MISLVRGPGGVLRRIGDDMLPFLVAGALAAFAAPFLGLLHALLLGALVWPLLSLVLRAVRRRPRLRRLYRVAVVAHILFWSVQGVLATSVTPAGALEMRGVEAWESGGTFRAGYAEALFELPRHATLAGWGSRPRRIRVPSFGGLGVLGRYSQRLMAAEAEPGAGPRLPLFRRPGPGAPADPLGARALVLRPGDDAGGPPAAIVRLDLVTSDEGLHAAVVDALRDLGYRRHTLLLAATHTHSGPGGYSDNAFSALLGTDHFDPAVFGVVRDAAVAAVRRAHAQAQPARLALVPVRDRDPGTGAAILARNRRAADRDRIDDRAYLLRVDAAATGAPIALVLNYAVHPLLHRRRHMAFDRDLAGGLESALRARVAGAPPVLFINGAQGDISSTAGPGTADARIAHLAEAFAAVVAPAVDAAAGAARADLRLAFASVRRRMATPHLIFGFAGERAGVLDAVGRPYFRGDAGGVIADVLALPANAAVWSLGVSELRVGFSWDGAAAASFNLEAAMGPGVCRFGAWVFESGGERFALLWEPGEALQALGRTWRAAAAERGLAHTLVVGLANGSASYFTPEEAYVREGYEAEATFFGRHTGSDATDALTGALDAALGSLR